MYTLAIANQKGGVGKSTTCFVVGSILRAEGYRVLFIDADGQGNLGRLVNAGSGSTTLFDVLHGADVRDAIKDTANGFILPSDARLAAERTPAQDLAESFTDLLEAVSNDYDVCIIDTQPSLSAVTVAAIAASNGVLVPTMPDRFSVDGLRAFGKTVNALCTVNPQLRIVGVIVTQFYKSTSLHKQVIPALRAQAELLGTQLYEPPIRRAVAIQEMQYTGELVKGGAIDDYANIVKRLKKDLNLKKGSAEHGKEL